VGRVRVRVRVRLGLGLSPGANIDPNQFACQVCMHWWQTALDQGGAVESSVERF